MDVVFMGTPDFAVPSLERLAETHRVIGVYTRPDAASKRGRSLVAPPVKVAAQRLHVPVFQPLTLRDPAEIDRLRTLSPDVICVAAYGMILPSQVLEIPQHGCINVHASLLPRYRGAAPIHRAVLDGATTVGVSIMRMEEGLDTGPYALQRAIDVDDLDVPELTSRLGSIGAEALVETLADMESGSVEWTVQNDAEATYANKVTREDVELDPALTVSEAVRRVRASTRQAPAALEIDGTRSPFSRRRLTHMWWSPAGCSRNAAVC